MGMSMIIEKLWGTTECLLKTPLVEVHLIKVKPSMRCSWHLHERKWNAFFWVSGVLCVRGDGDDPIDAVILGKEGSFAVVPPGVYHSFSTGEAPAVALEIYYPDTLGEDIIRRDLGGCLSAEDQGHEERVQDAGAVAAVQGAGGWVGPGREGGRAGKLWHAQGRHPPEDENSRQQKGQQADEGMNRPWSTIRVVWSDPEHGGY